MSTQIIKKFKTKIAHLLNLPTGFKWPCFSYSNFTELLIYKHWYVLCQGFVDVMQASFGEAFSKEAQRLYEDIAIKQAWLCHETETQGT